MVWGGPTGKCRNCLTLLFEPGGSQLALQAGTFRVGRDWHPLKFCPNTQRGSTGSTHLSLGTQQKSQRQQQPCQSTLVSRLQAQPTRLGSVSGAAVDLLLSTGQVTSVLLSMHF